MHHDFATRRAFKEKDASNRPLMMTSNRRAFTLVECLTVIATVGLLVTLTLAAVQYARESARRGQCSSNLRQMGIALQSYHSTFGGFPLGNTRGFSFHTAILPQVELSGVEGQINRSATPGSVKNAVPRAELIPLYLCPSDPGGSVAAKDASHGTDYAGNYGRGFQRYGYDGIFRAANLGNRAGVSAREVTDGLSRTAAVAEILIGTGALQTPGRVIFSTAPLTGPANLDAFASACAAITAQTTLGAPDLWSRGRPWIEGDLHATGYNHILAPNQNNCTNGTSVMSGAYSSASMHPSGIELLYADGHAEFISSSIAIEVWRALGSRDGGEAQ